MFSSSNSSGPGDINKLRDFEEQLLKLKAAQTEFFQKLEALNGSMPDKIDREFNLIGMVQDGNMKLVVQDDYMKKIPLKLPTHAVADLKKGIQDLMNGCFITLWEAAKNKGGLDITQLESRLEEEQARRLSSFFDKMNDLCAEPDALEQELAEYKKQLLYAKRVPEDPQQQISMAQASEKVLKQEHELQISKKEDAIADLKKKIKALQKQQERLAHATESATNVQTMEQEERKRLAQEIVSLKHTQLNLNKKLELKEVAHKRALCELRDKDEVIGQLQRDLEECEKLLENVRARSKEEVAQKLHEKSKEVRQLKATIEESKKGYAAINRKYNAARKELEEFQDFKIQVELSAAKIKKLEEELVKKDKQLRERPLSPKQYPTKINSLLKANKKLKCEKVELQGSLKVFKHWTGRLLGELKRITEMHDLRRDIEKMREESQAEQRERMKEDHETAEESPFTPCKAHSGKLSQQIQLGTQNKSEELLALYSYLGSKGLDQIRQKHKIDLLEERNARTEQLRVKQQEEIARLRHEVYALKHEVYTLKQSKNPRNIPQM